MIDQNETSLSIDFLPFIGSSSVWSISKPGDIISMTYLVNSEYHLINAQRLYNIFTNILFCNPQSNLTDFKLFIEFK